MDTIEHPPGEDLEAARRLIEKLRRFAADELDPDERALFGALIAPGLWQALVEDDDQVHGYSTTHWTPGRLPEALSAALKRSGLQVVDPDEGGSGH